jgi:phage protein D/phage baseplate assembly protein gpV
MSNPSYAPRFEIRITGVTLSADVTDQVLSVSYDNNLDMADMFSVTLRNPNNQFTDSALFDLGKEVEIHMGYGNDLKPMMLGELTGIEPSYPASGPPTITISGYDRSHRLRHDQPDRPAYQYMNDSAIAAMIAGQAGLIPVVDPSPFFHEHKQQTGTDMAFLLERARANFFECYVWWDKLYFRFPRPQTEAVVLERGRSLSSFMPRLSSAALAGLQIVRGYNAEMARSFFAVVGAADLAPNDLIEKLGSTAKDLLTKLGRRVIRDLPMNTPADAAQLATSILLELLEGMYEGSGSCVGNPALRADGYVMVKGVGKRFSGRYRLKKVTHTIDESGYHTHFEVTQRARASLLGFLRKTLGGKTLGGGDGRLDAPVVGTVTDNVDPKGLGRIKVKLPWFSDDNESAWARLSTPMAGDNGGAFFLPDRNDEVLIGFQQGDINNPIVLGAVWNGEQRPPEHHTDGQNRIRLIQTKAGHLIKFDDTNGAEKITIQDKKGSTITMDSNTGEVKIHSAGDLTLDSSKKINIKSTGDITINNGSVTATLSSSGMDVT